MLDLAVLGTVFGLIFVGELPDKTAIAGLVLGTRYPWRWAYAGIAAAFATHVVIAVAAGSLIALLPHRPVAVVTAVLFLLGAVLIYRTGREEADDDSAESAGTDDDGSTAGFWKVAGLGYLTVFLAEWGDLTQILTANLAARYDDPFSVGLGAVLALWAVGLIATLGGKTLLRWLPIKWITRAAAIVLAVLGVLDIISAVRG